MGCFSSGCFKEELLDILRCIEMHELSSTWFRQVQSSDVFYLFRRQAICRLIVSNDLDLYEFRKGDLAAGFSSGGFLGTLDYVWASWPTQIAQFWEYKLIVVSALAQSLWWHNVSGNSLVKGNVSSGSQQQYLARNSQARVEIRDVLDKHWSLASLITWICNRDATGLHFSGWWLDRWCMERGLCRNDQCTNRSLW